ncbi:50S ribosome-binding GTPase [Nodularia spumigena CS-584]|jgi:uncharacterized protein|uniref:GTPase Era n=2 Tax=Nodularia spumigena TaxID=70799 RepID=A0A2S0Q9J8_NODSP|nr:GTPase [Nodularia spumigena]AHJ31491.1 putative GTPase [Nodularia spumigena CCY9414]AVZ31048.1 GTPase Era [Nodularia spumigena UHCC 0039]EAW46833.1 CP4-57 prophage; putative GTP-binding factor [Nodularia spumigena CCY9414]MDB9318466.1 50S ribosome-binding GTPase [Nodularia spumigena CS-590/01A]MDB9326061.1 50S ribosome-binding GTPase [Nodularia spumigena CS-590/02]
MPDMPEESSDIPQPVLEKIFSQIRQVFTEHPPTIGVIGVSGTGKSSVINTLFGTRLDISHTKACTKDFMAIELEVIGKKAKKEGKKTTLRVFDAPGLGEDIERDPNYLEMYHKYLPQCDVILYLISARNRAIALDQKYIQELKAYSNKMLFAISQVDLVEPCDWANLSPIPSQSQDDNIQEIIKDREPRISKIVEQDVKLIPFSSYRGYNLEVLFNNILSTCKDDRAWLFDVIKSFSYEDFLPSNIQ